MAPTLEIEETDFGVRIFSARDTGEGNTYLRISNFIYPNLSAFPGGGGTDGYSVNWHVPITDVTHWKYSITFNRATPLDKERLQAAHAASIDPDYHMKRTKANRYLQDREEMQTKTWLGIGTFFPTHDALATEGAGAVQDRTLEHTSTTDKAIVMQRLQLLKAIGQLKDGGDPPHLFRDPKRNRLGHVGAIDMIIPSSENWRESWPEYWPHLDRALVSA